MTNIAAGQLKAFVERVERVEDDIREYNADKSDIYKEMKAQGYDVKIVKKIIAARRLESHVREEQDAVYETYWDALHGVSHVHALAHVENIEQFPLSSASPASQAADEKAVPPFNKRGTALLSSEGGDEE